MRTRELTALLVVIVTILVSRLGVNVYRSGRYRAYFRRGMAALFAIVGFLGVLSFDGAITLVYAVSFVAGSGFLIYYGWRKSLSERFEKE